MFSAAAASGPVTATFVTTAGTFKAELMTDTMPITTSNFIDLCQSGFYDGVHFHRVSVVAEPPCHSSLLSSILRARPVSGSCQMLLCSTRLFGSS